MKLLSLIFSLTLSLNAFADGKITNADVYSAAAIATTKLAAKTANNVATYSGTGFLGNGVAPSTSGNILTSNGTLWTSASPGNLTAAGTDGIAVTSGTGAVLGAGTSLAQQVSDATHNGYLSSANWTTFNAKQAAGNYITALTGDVTAAGPGSSAATLATVNSNVGSFTISSLTVNAKGLVTAASSASTTGSGNVVLATSPTIVTPTIAKIANLTTNGFVRTGSSDGTLSVQTDPCTVAQGCTGLATLTLHALQVGTGTSAITQIAVPASGTLLTGVAASDPAFSATPTLGVAGATKGTLAFAGNTSGTVTVQPAAAAGTWSMTLPTDGGSSGQFLQTNGSGVTSWQTSTGSTGSILNVGTWKSAQTTSCKWITTSSTIANYAADTDCPTPTVTGGITAAGTKIPAVVFTVSDANDVYYFTAIGGFGKDSNANYYCQYRFSDGTSSSSLSLVRTEASSTMLVPVISGTITFGSTGAKTVNIQAANSNNSSDCIVSNDINDVQINVWKVDN